MLEVVLWRWPKVASRAIEELVSSSTLVSAVERVWIPPTSPCSTKRELVELRSSVIAEVIVDDDEEERASGSRPMIPSCFSLQSLKRHRH